ncbi:MAG: major capsid protein P2 [Thalassobaculaceae bacterium]
MGLNNIKLPALNAVGAGQTATLDVPLGPTYHQIDLIYRSSGTLGNEATMKADIPDIRVKIAGKAQRTHSAAQVLEVNQFYGETTSDGVISLFFAEPWRRTPQGEDFYAWGTADVPTFQIEVDVASGALAPTLEAYATISRARRPLGAIKRMRRFVVPVTATGDVQVQNLPKIGTSYNALHMIETTAGDINSVLVEVDQTKVWDTPAFLANSLYAQRDLVPQSGIFHVVFDYDKRAGSPLSMVKADGSVVSDFMVTANMAVAANVTILTEETGLRF